MYVAKISILPKSPQCGIGYHCGFEVEAPVAEVEEHVQFPLLPVGAGLDLGGSAAQDLAGGERL